VDPEEKEVVRKRREWKGVLLVLYFGFMGG
jgi:hypothetical protein